MRSPKKMQLCIALLGLLTSQVFCACPDGIYEPATEQCDDGNTVGGDGCSPTCQLESATQWLCTNIEGETTQCCTALTNPITLEKVCSCADAVQPPTTLGWYINEKCQKQDINECAVNRGGCHKNAQCLNYDSVVNCRLTYECKCPAGLHGNGKTSCNTNAYKTKFKLTLQDSSISKEEMVYELKLNGVIPATVPDENIEIVFANAFSLTGAARRRLLQTEGGGGTEATVVITSDSEEEMETVTESISFDNVPEAYTVISTATSETSDGESYLVETSTTGLVVDSLDYIAADNKWKVSCRFKTDLDSTIFSPFISKFGDVEDVALNTWQTAPNNFPCLTDPTVCCLKDYAERYMVGGFADTINSTVGDCTGDVLSNRTVDLFDPTALKYVPVQQIFADHPQSSVSMPTSGELIFDIFADDIAYHFAKRENNADGSYSLNFFVGMAMLTMLQGPVLAASSTQTALSIHVTPTMTFSMTGETSYSFVDYMTLAIHQNKYLDPTLVIRYPQMVQFSLLLPSGLQQDMETGLIPLRSIRFAIATSLPDRQNASLWNNPCLSDSGTDGYWDENSTFHELYDGAGSQSCALDLNICQNPATAVLPNRLAKFNFPIGDEVITAAMQGADAGQYRLYVSFEVSTKSADGTKHITSVFAESLIHQTSVSKHCEEISSSVELSSVVQIDLAVGLVGQDSQWDQSVSVANDVMADQTFIDNGIYDLGTTHTSLQTSMITLVAKGRPVLQASRLPTDYYLSLDSFISMHFLDNDKFNEVLTMIGTSDGAGGNLGYSVQVNEETGFMDLSFSTDATFVCVNAEDVSFSCGMKNSVANGVVTDPNAIAGLYNTDHSENNDGPVAMITGNLLSNNEFSRELSLNMTSITRSRFGLNGYLNQGWFVNPGFPWPKSSLGSGYQSYFALSDKIIGVGVVSMRDSATGAVSNRRLLTIVSDEDGGVNVEEDELDVKETREEPVTDTLLLVAEKENSDEEDDIRELAEMMEKELIDAAGKLGDAVARKMSRKGRNLLSVDMVSDEVLTRLRDTPIYNNLPSLQFNTNVAKIYKEIFALPESDIAQVEDVKMDVNTGLSDSEIIAAVTKSFEDASKLVCSTCTTFKVVSVVIQREKVVGRRRRLLQTTSGEVKVFAKVVAASNATPIFKEEEVVPTLKNNSIEVNTITSEMIATTMAVGDAVDCSGCGSASPGTCPTGCKAFDQNEANAVILGLSIPIGFVIFVGWVYVLMSNFGTGAGSSEPVGVEYKSLKFFAYTP